MKKKVKFENIKNSKGKTDWMHLKSSEAEIFDVKAPALTEAELSQLRKVKKR